MTNSSVSFQGSPNKMTRVTLPNCLNVGVHLIDWDPLGCSHLKSLFIGIKGRGDH